LFESQHRRQSEHTQQQSVFDHVSLARILVLFVRTLFYGGDNRAFPVIVVNVMIDDKTQLYTAVVREFECSPVFLGVTTTTKEGNYDLTRLDPTKKFKTSQWR